MIKKFHLYNESLRDKMTPKSESEISNIVDEKFLKLEELMQDLFLKERWDDIKTFIEIYYDDINDLFIGEWSLEEVYNEYKHKISNHLEDLEDEQNDTDDFYK